MKNNSDENSVEQVEAEPVRETTTTEEQKGEGQPLEAADPLPVVEPSSGVAHQHDPAQSADETDRKQDEAIDSLADQTEWIKKQTSWIRFQSIASALLGAFTLGVLVYHGWILSKQQTAMEQSVTKQIEAIQQTDRSIGQTKTLIEQQDRALGYANTQASAAISQAEAAKTQADASMTQARTSGVSARAAEQSARIATQAFDIGERPYVAVNTIKLIDFETAKSPRVEVVLDNTGKTPALSFRGHVYSTLRKEPRLGQANYPPVGMVSENIIPSGGNKKQFLNLLAGERQAIIDRVIELVKERQLWLFVYGVVTYNDGAGRPHTLRYCGFWSVDRSEFLSCAEHNNSN